MCKLQQKDRTMERVRKITYMTAVYIFLSEMRPFDPYRSAYYTGPDGNVSLSEVANVLEPIKSYSVLFVGCLMLVTADYLLYKPNIMILTAWSGISYILVTNSPSVTKLEVSVVGMGAIYCTETLALSYLYAQIEDPSQFQMATGVLTAANQLGKFAGDALAQYVVDATGGKYDLLPYITSLLMFLAFIWTIFLPSIKRKNQFLNKPHTESSEKSRLLVKSTEEAFPDFRDKTGRNIDEWFVQVKADLKETWTNFKISYSNPTIIKKSLWLVFGMTSYIEVIANINVLYSYVVERTSNQNVYSNGLAEAIATLSGAAGAYISGSVQLDWTNHGDSITAFCSVLMGILIISLYYYDSIIFVYVSYILFGFVYQALFVALYTEVAKRLAKKCYTAVFQINVIGTQTLVSVTTLFLVQLNFMHITIPGRFLFFGGLFVMLGIVFSLISILNCIRKRTIRN